MLTVSTMLKKVCAAYPSVSFDEAFALFDNKDERVHSSASIKVAFPPFFGHITDNCKGIKFNYGLHTQCESAMEDGDYCVKCAKEANANDNGKPNCGDIRDRKDCGILDYVDPKGRKTISYASYLLKKGYTEDEMLRFIDDSDMIPEEHKKYNKRRGTKAPKDPSKPKKILNAYMRYLGEMRADVKAEMMKTIPDVRHPQVVKKVSEMWAELSAEEKRPYQEAYEQEKAAMTSSDVSVASSSPAASVVSKASSKISIISKTSKVSKAEEREAAKAAKVAEREAAKVAKAAEREAAKAAKKAEREAAKAAKKAKKEEVVVVADSDSAGIESGVSESSGTPVFEFEYNGNTYYRTSDGDVFDEDETQIGIWDEDKKEIIEIEFDE